MKPTDIRDAVWRELRDQLAGDRAEVYAALTRMSSPATARDLAAAMRRDVLSVAPRLTELCQTGLAELAGRTGRRGLYRAIPFNAAVDARSRLRSAPAGSEQMALRFD